ncbi:MAG TPA: sigma 54-interacting transcriptional regulator [Gemmatimonadaceae bacterium]|nr:sigma 54-interacting transcriptional regulator [Gemmatimonadaceae bacterium]
MTGPSLVVEALSDSFGTLWQELASDLELPLQVLEPATRAADAERTILLLAAGGAEATLVDAARRSAAQGLTFAAIAADADYRLAANVLRAGADQLFVLPRDLDLLRSWLKERCDALLARSRQRAFSQAQVSKFRFEGIFGASPALVHALERAARVIPHGSVTVLLTGETGTGKELFARAIHYNGPRREGPFVDINCAALPEHLLESELFGHEKGAFTGATVAKPGLFEVANGGTIFLDEIGHLALALQGKLLRAIQERSIRPLGGTRTVSVDVRIIAATHVDLASAVQRREFREDLYYRLNVLPIALPPLRERRDDILPLARHFLAQFADEYDVDAPALTPAAARALREREWPGNIRELRNAIERAVLLGNGALDESSFVPDLPAGEPAPVSGTLSDVIRSAVQRAIDAHGGNKSAAARRLGISRTRLQRILDGEQENGERDQNQKEDAS